MIRLEGASVEFPGGVRALDGVSLEFAHGQTTCLVGASGSGKSTLLRLVNRLVEPTAGRVLLDGRDARSLDPIALRRGMGYAMQRGGLLPHLTVTQNAELVPRLLGWPPRRAAEAAARTLSLVRLDPVRYGPRRPGTLSGGERERASIARALAADPAVLLLDEPLGALDQHLRETLQDELRDLFARLGKTVVCVTHDMHVAVGLAHRVAVLSGGRLAQFGTPRQVVREPADERVLALLGRRREALLREAGEGA
ncbi:MAG: ATP-binding cassette domain-containing protein [Elusimicrobia bacterium]|nr:ATP-binding cassette domain-containing protein [Elusimicrobiota bacterium]